MKRNCIAFALLALLFTGPASAEDALQKIAPANDHFSILMPGTPKILNLQISNPIYKDSKTKSYIVQRNNSLYMLIVTTFSGSSSPSILDKVQADIMSRETAAKHSDITLNGQYPGRELTYTTSKGTDSINRMYFVDNRLYSLNIAGNRKFVHSASAKKFLNSLVITQ